MSGPDQSALASRLLRAMRPDDYALIRPHLRHCTATRGEVWFRKDEVVETVWFMDSGLCSLVAISPEGQRVKSRHLGP